MLFIICPWEVYVFSLMEECPTAQIHCRNHMNSCVLGRTIWFLQCLRRIRIHHCLAKRSFYMEITVNHTNIQDNSLILQGPSPCAFTSMQNEHNVGVKLLTYIGSILMLSGCKDPILQWGVGWEDPSASALDIDVRSSTESAHVTFIGGAHSMSYLAHNV